FGNCGARLLVARSRVHRWLPSTEPVVGSHRRARWCWGSTDAAASANRDMAPARGRPRNRALLGGYGVGTIVDQALRRVRAGFLLSTFALPSVLVVFDVVEGGVGVRCRLHVHDRASERLATVQGAAAVRRGHRRAR